MFEILPDGLLRLALYVGTAAAALVFVGGIAAVVLAERSDRKLAGLTQELIDTRAIVSGRTIKPEQVELLKGAIEECWRGVNVQVYDREDAEAASLAFSLTNAFADAGFATFPYELPRLEVGGFDLTIYLTRAVTEEKFREIAFHSALYKSLISFGFTVGPTNWATNTTKHQIIIVTDEEKYRVLPDYCIVQVN